MTDLDRTSIDRILPSTPGSADWEDVLRRSGAPHGGRHRRLVVLAAAALVVFVGTVSAFGSVRDFFLDRGFIGLPPAGATPSAPESGELVVQWEGNSATHARPHPGGFLLAPLVRAWVYADGRMIWSWTKMAGRIPEGANELTSGYLEQRLTPEGVELLRSEVAGLFDRSRTLLETFRADDDPRLRCCSGLALFVPRDYGSDFGSVEVPHGDRRVRLQWRDIGTENSPQFEGTIATPEQLSALRRVDALLTDPASVLPSSAWAVREVRAYVPSHYEVCIDTSPPKDASDLLSLLPTRAADALRDKSQTRLEGDVEGSPNGGGPVVLLGRSVTYCSKLTTEEAREVAEPLSGFDPDPHQWGRLAYRLAEGAHDVYPTTIWFEPYFPHGQVTCSACG
jgi:hypothetical protein